MRTGREDARFGTAAWPALAARCRARAAAAPRWSGRCAAIVARRARRGRRALVRLTARFDGVRSRRAELRVPPRRDPRARAARRPGAGRSAARAWPRASRRSTGGRRGAASACGSPTARCSRSACCRSPRPASTCPAARGAYPSSVLMSAIPARVAGVPRLVVVTPPRTLEQNPAVAAALVVAGLEDARLPRRRRAGDRGARLRHAQASRRSPRSSGPATPTSPRRSAQVRGPGRDRQRRGAERGRGAGRRQRRRGLGGGGPAGAGRARQRRRDGRAGDAVARRWPREVARLVGEGRASVANRAQHAARARAQRGRRAGARPGRRRRRGQRAGARARRGDDARRGAAGAARSWRARSSSAPTRPSRSATTESGRTTCCRPAARPASPRRSRCATSSGARAASR